MKNFNLRDDRGGPTIEVIYMMLGVMGIAAGSYLAFNTLLAGGSLLDAVKRGALGASPWLALSVLVAAYISVSEKMHLRRTERSTSQG